MKKNNIIIIGGGAAGTAAAHTLSQKGYTVTILEKNDRLGGRIHSITTDDAIFEVGAGFVSDFYTNTLKLIKSTGLEKYLQTRKSYSALVRNGTLHPLLSKSAIFGTSILSNRAKLQFARELFKITAIWNKIDPLHMWKMYPYDKQSISQAFIKKNEQELLEYFIQPALDGYFYWSAKNISEAMLMIIFKTLLTRQHTYILKCGLQRIPEKAAEGSHLLLAHEVTQVQKISKNEYEVTVKSNKSTKKLRANGIICATTATIVPKIMGLNKKQLAFFASVHYSTTAVAAKTFNPKITPQNYNIAYPRKERTTIGAITIISDIMKDEIKKTTLVKLYASGASGKKLCIETDDKIDATLSKAAFLSNKVFDTSANPTFRYIQR